MEAEQAQPSESQDVEELASSLDIPFEEKIKKMDLPEDEPLTLEFDVNLETTLEIPETMDETLIIIEQEPRESPLIFEAENLPEPDELALPAQEIEDEIKQAALLWAEQWGSEESDELFPEAIENSEVLRPTLFEMLPIEPTELAEKLETLPEASLQEAAAILGVVLEMVGNYLDQEVNEESDSEKPTERLVQIVERLLVCLEIEHEEKQVLALVEALLNGEVDVDFENILERQDEGTHERKYISAWILMTLKQRTTPKQVDHSFIGRYVMRISFSELRLSFT